MSSSQQQVTRTGSFRAVVQAGVTATVYLRSGSGRPVLILRKDSAEHPIWTPLVEAISARFRVIAPEPDQGRDDFGGWLRHFLEGLGIPPVQIVADGAMAAPAIGFAVLEADRVERLVVISPCGQDALSQMIPVGPPTLLIRDDQPSDSVIGLVLSFLEEQAAVPLKQAG